MIIDVSHNNGTINWAQVKPNIEKAILRVGYGDDIASQDDKKFQQNLAECRRLGIPIDFYIYSYAKSTTQAISEANHILRLTNGLDGILYFDSEQKGTEGAARGCAEAFRDKVKSAGKKVGIYASESWYNSFLKGIGGFDSIWIAKYGSNNGQQNQRPNIDCNLWQYTSRGSVPGISGSVDCNVWLKPVDPPKPQPFVPPAIVKNGVYRLYNSNSGEHFFTISSSERDNLIKAGWKYENVGWKAPSKSNTPVYRLYNPNDGGEHFYTTSKSEVDRLAKAGWKKEDVAFYSDDKKKTPIYRLYNKNSGKHMFTASVGEKNSLVKAGLQYEGVSFYGI